MAGKTRCRVHGGTSTGARSLDGKQRQAEGRQRYFAQLRGRQGGSAKATIPAPPVSTPAAAARKAASTTATPVERMRLDALSNLPPQPAPKVCENERLADADRVADVPPPHLEQSAEPELVTIYDCYGDPITVKPTSPEAFRRVLDELFPNGVFADAKPQPAKPALAVANPAPQPGPPAVLPPVIVEDTSKLANEVEDIAQAAIERIKELLKHPFDSEDPNFAALLRFLSSTYNTSMITIARTDDNRLKRQAVSRLDYILERAAEERRKRDARSAIEGTTVNELHDTRTTSEVPYDDAS